MVVLCGSSRCPALVLLTGTARAPVGLRDDLPGSGLSAGRLPPGFTEAYPELPLLLCACGGKYDEVWPELGLDAAGLTTRGDVVPQPCWLARVVAGVGLYAESLSSVVEVSSLSYTGGG